MNLAVGAAGTIIRGILSLLDSFWVFAATAADFVFVAATDFVAEAAEGFDLMAPGFWLLLFEGREEDESLFNTSCLAKLIVFVKFFVPFMTEERVTVSRSRATTALTTFKESSAFVGVTLAFFAVDSCSELSSRVRFS